jgi:hypothetical protein
MVILLRRGPRSLLRLALLLAICLAGACDDDDPTGETPDTTAPSPVIDLGVVALSDSSATLRWTAPGDDGREGTATEYDIRWAETPIATGGDFEAASRVMTAPPPLQAGTQQELLVWPLTQNTRYYFAIRAVDERGNRSEISNVASATLPAGAFALEIRVTDAASNPVPGLRIKLHVPIPGFTWAKPAPRRDAGKRAATAIEFAVPEPSHVRLTLFDLLDVPVRHLLDGQLAGGVHSAIYDATSDAGIPFLGTVVFRCRLEGLDPVTEAARYTEDVYAVLYTGDDQDARPILGLTDADGRVATYDMTLFPGLFELPPLPLITETGEAVGTFEIPNAIVLTLEDPGTTVSHDVDFTVGPGLNRVQAVWLEGQPVPAAVPAARLHQVRPAVADLRVLNVPIPVTEWDLRPNRPNPFH